MQNPTKIKLNKTDETLELQWKNGENHAIPLKFLRDESPDATNKGETILWKHIPPPPKGADKPGKYEIEKITKVGNYAISITWKDGYDYGIYNWELLYEWGEFHEVKKSIKGKL